MGDRMYMTGEFREGSEEEFRHLIPHVLRRPVTTLVEKAEPAAPKNKAEKAAPANKAATGKKGKARA